MSLLLLDQAATFSQTNINVPHHHCAVSALIISRLDYCNSVLVGAYDIHLWQLQGVLNAAARLIARRRKFDSISSASHDVFY